MKIRGRGSGKRVRGRKREKEEGSMIYFLNPKPKSHF